MFGERRDACSIERQSSTGARQQKGCTRRVEVDPPTTYILGTRYKFFSSYHINSYPSEWLKRAGGVLYPTRRVRGMVALVAHCQPHFSRLVSYSWRQPSKLARRWAAAWLIKGVAHLQNEWSLGPYFLPDEDDKEIRIIKIEFDFFPSHLPLHRARFPIIVASTVSWVSCLINLKDRAYTVVISRLDGRSCPRWDPS